jgi:hypothetical protein
MQTIESISTAKINISSVTLKHLHSSQLLPKNCIMHCSEASIVPLIHPLPLALPVELRISSSALFIERKNELNGLCVAVVCCGVKQRASGPIDEVVDVGKVLFYQLECALATVAEFDGFEHPPQHIINNKKSK